MTTVADRYRRLAADVSRTIEQVPPDRWSSPSPCEGWTALDVARHLVEVHGLFLGLVGRTLDPAPSVEEDVRAAWRAARDQLQADLDDPARAGEEFDGFFGRTSLGAAVGRFVCFDLLIHRWDLARAAGLDDRLDPGEVAHLWEAAAGFGDTIRTEGVCGPAIEPPPDADEQTRLLCFLGRRA
jgi:uncharacterized protein (TIGR03086 family)